jgi:redox-sensing transcriptional repressor
MGIFDSNPALKNQYIRGVKIQSMENLEQFCIEKQIKVAILCLPKDSVEFLADTLIEKANVRCFWNFSHYDISLRHEGVIAENVHMSDSLMTLCYRIQDFEEKAEPSSV